MLRGPLARQVKTILAVTHDFDLLRALRRDLPKTGWRVVRADGGKVALTRMQQQQPDLVLLDLELNGEDGFTVCERLRQSSAVPILVLVSCLEHAERAIGQEVGADDFVVKPAGARQVTARIQTLLHWAERRDATSSAVILSGDLELNPVHHRVTIAGEPIDLTRTELALLAALAAVPGRALSRAQLMDALEHHRSRSARTVDSHIKNLRAKIEPDPCHPRYVLTVYGVGYKLRNELAKAETQPTQLGCDECE